MVLLSYFVSIAFAYETDNYNFEYPIEKEEPLTEREELLLLVAEYAKEYDVSFQQMVNTIQCESGFQTDVQSIHRYKDGTREQSYGLVQIHLPAHPNVTYEQAVNPDFAIRFLAENFALGKESMWTCWRELYDS